MLENDSYLHPWFSLLLQVNFGCSDVVALQLQVTERFSIIFTEHQPESTCVTVSDRCCPDVSAVIKTPPVGNILIQMDDPHCNSDSGGSAPSVCLDDLFQLCNLDSCFRGQGLLTIRVMMAYELSGPRMALCALNREAPMTQVQHHHHPGPLDPVSTCVNTACVSANSWLQTPPERRSSNWEKLHCGLFLEGRTKTKWKVKVQVRLKIDKIWFLRSKVEASIRYLTILTLADPGGARIHFQPLILMLAEKKRDWNQ